MADPNFAKLLADAFAKDFGGIPNSSLEKKIKDIRDAVANALANINPNSITPGTVGNIDITTILSPSITAAAYKKNLRLRAEYDKLTYTLLNKVRRYVSRTNDVFTGQVTIDSAVKQILNGSNKQSLWTSVKYNFLARKLLSNISQFVDKKGKDLFVGTIRPENAVQSILNTDPKLSFWTQHRYNSLSRALLSSINTFVKDSGNSLFSGKVDISDAVTTILGTDRKLSLWTSHKYNSLTRTLLGKIKAFINKQGVKLFDGKVQANDVVSILLGDEESSLWTRHVFNKTRRKLLEKIKKYINNDLIFDTTPLDAIKLLGIDAHDLHDRDELKKGKKRVNIAFFDSVKRFFDKDGLDLGPKTEIDVISLLKIESTNFLDVQGIKRGFRESVKAFFDRLQRFFNTGNIKFKDSYEFDPVSMITLTPMDQVKIRNKYLKAVNKYVERIIHKMETGAINLKGLELPDTLATDIGAAIIARINNANVNLNAFGIDNKNSIIDSHIKESGFNKGPSRSIIVDSTNREIDFKSIFCGCMEKINTGSGKPSDVPDWVNGVANDIGAAIISRIDSSVAINNPYNNASKESAFGPGPSRSIIVDSTNREIDFKSIFCGCMEKINTGSGKPSNANGADTAKKGKSIADFILSLMTGISLLKNSIIKIISSIGHKIKGAWNWMSKGLSKATSWVGDKASKATSWVGNKASKAAGWVGDKASKATSWVGNKASKAAGWVGDKSSKAAGWVGDKASKATSWVGDKASKAASWVGEKTGNTAGWVGDKASKAAGWVGDKVSKATSWVGDKASKAASWVGEKTGNTAGWIGDKVSKATSWVGDKVSKATSWAGNKVVAAKNVIVKSLSAAKVRLFASLSKLAGGVRGYLKYIFKIPVISTAITALFAAHNINKIVADTNLTVAQKEQQVGAVIIKSLGAILGGVGGAALLTPIPGGTIIGGILGAMLGEYVADWIASHIDARSIGRLIIEVFGLNLGRSKGDSNSQQNEPAAPVTISSSASSNPPQSTTISSSRSNIPKISNDYSPTNAAAGGTAISSIRSSRQIAAAEHLNNAVETLTKTVSKSKEVASNSSPQNIGNTGGGGGFNSGGFREPAYNVRISAWARLRPGSMIS